MRTYGEPRPTVKKQGVIRMEPISIEPDAERASRVQSVDRAMLLLRADADAAPQDSTAARLA